MSKIPTHVPDKQIEEEAEAAPPTHRRLTDAGRAQLNRLLNEGMSLAQAMQHPSLLWDENVPAPPKPDPKPRFDPALLAQLPTRFSTKDDVDRALESFFARLVEDGLLAASDLIGVSPRELDRLEARRGLLLPYAYRRFLELAGAKRCRLYSYNHFGVEFPLIKKYRAADVWKIAQTFALDLKTRAPDLFPITGHLGDTYWLVRTTPQERALDALVFCVSEFAEPRLAYPSVLGWLEAFAEEALQALRRGYFNFSPNGTSP